MQLENVSCGVSHLSWSALRRVLGVVRLREANLGAVRELGRPAVAVPTLRGLVESSRGFSVLINRIWVPRPFGDAVKIEKITIFEQNH